MVRTFFPTEKGRERNTKTRERRRREREIQRQEKEEGKVRCVLEVFGMKGEATILTCYGKEKKIQ